MQIEVAEARALSVEAFLALANLVWPRAYDASRAASALARTINIGARGEGGQLLGCARILTDGYFFGTIPEILVHPQWQRRGIGRALLDVAWEQSPTGLFFGAQSGNEPFFERCGFERGLQSFQRRKPRGAPIIVASRTLDLPSNS
ncbi:MAG: GNAT family N-acetyltransferase [Gemmatimonadaceae bacterium]|nr:GNAT family N-acetyltransferase [Gemmatimonadaceae bacterium]